MRLVEMAAALLTLMIVLSSSAHRPDPLSRSVQVVEATLHAAHLLHADTPWAAQTVSEHVRIPAPVEVMVPSGPATALDLVDQTLRTRVRVLRTDRPPTERDLSEGVHPDRTHAPPSIS